MVHEASRRPLTSMNQLRRRAGPVYVKICGGQTGTVTGFSPSTLDVPCQNRSTSTPNAELRRKPRPTFCVSVRPWLHSYIQVWVPSFWTLRILGNLAQGPSGTLVKEQGFSNLVQNMGHKLPVLRPMCVGPGRARTQILLSIYQYSKLMFLLHLSDQKGQVGERSGDAIILSGVRGALHRKGDSRCFKIKTQVGLHVRWLLFLSGDKQNTECAMEAVTCGLTDGHKWLIVAFHRSRHFKGSQCFPLQGEAIFLDCLTQKTMAPRYFKSKGTIHPTTKRCIAEDFSHRQTLQ